MYSPMTVSLVGRTTSGSSSSLPPAWVTTASSGLKPSTCSASRRQVALRDEQREVDVLGAGRLDAEVDLGLHPLPDGVAVGPDDHRAPHRAVVGQLGLGDDVLVPAGEVLGLGGEDGLPWPWWPMVGVAAAATRRACLWMSSTRLLAGVGVVALLGQERGPVLLGLPGGLLGVDPGDGGVDAVLVDELGPLDEGGRPSRPRARRRRCGPSRTGGRACLPAAMPMSASRASPGPVDDAAHHRDLQRDLPVAERLHGLAWPPRSRRSRPGRSDGQAMRSMFLRSRRPIASSSWRPGPGLLHRVGGEAVADRVADALGQQRGHAGGGLEQAGGRRARPR